MKTINFLLTLVAATALASSVHHEGGLHGDVNPAGSGDLRGGAKDRLAVAGFDDGDPYPLSNKGSSGGGLDYGSLNQDGGGHGGAIRRLGQFDGQQAIRSELGDVGFGPDPHGDVEGEVVAGSEKDAQASGLRVPNVSNNGGVLVRTQDSSSSLPYGIGSNHFEANAERALEVYTPSTCTAGFVDCVGGFLRSNPSVACADTTDANACGGNCCVGTNACELFTGMVCRDGSCSGGSACRNTEIPEVINSCKPWGTQIGDRSCSSAGGDVGKMVDSCWGKWACYSLGRENGQVGDLTNSCHTVLNEDEDIGVCEWLGANGGSVGNVTSSCYGEETCYDLGRRGGVVGPVTNSCGSQVNGMSVETLDDVTNYPVMGYRNCFRVDYSDGVDTPISQITNCCQDGPYQCADTNIGGQFVDTDAQLIAKDPACAAAMPPTTNSPTGAPTTNSPTGAPTTKSASVLSVVKSDIDAYLDSLFGQNGTLKPASKFLTAALKAIADDDINKAIEKSNAASVVMDCHPEPPENVKQFCIGVANAIELLAEILLDV